MPSVVAYDFSNPFMAAAIVDDKGTRYPLWTKSDTGTEIAIQASDGNTLKALSFMTEMVIELLLGDIPKITITLSPPLADAIMLFDSELVEFGSHRVEVLFGYASGTATGQPLLSTTYEGLIIKPDFTLGVETTLTIHAVATGSYAAQQLGSQETFVDKTRHEIVATVLGRHGIELDIDDVTNGPADVRTLFEDDKISRSQGNKTDWTFAADLIRESICWSIQTEKLKMKISPRNSLLSKKPDFTLSLYQFQNGQIGGNVFPILGVNTTSAAIFLPGMRKIIQREIDPKTKKAVQKEHSDAKDTPARVAAPPNGSTDIKGSPYFPDADETKKLASVNTFPGDPANSLATDQANSVFQGLLGDALGFPLEIETMGMPNVIPGDVVSVQGLGLRLDHNYCVFKVTHTLGTSGYGTVLRLVSDVSAAVSQAIAVPPAGKENKDAAPTSPSDSVSVSPKAG